MIIQSIQSENFLKYENLDLSNLPERGLIAVSGQNESGKTTIGETLCFALFGRTFTLNLEDPRKLIRWSESQCSVDVAFSIGEDAIYQVRRYLDDEGSYGARLTRLHDGAVLAKGVEKVDAEVQALLGFGYEEFIESFYLAQRELSTPHPHSHTIKVMAGIAPLAKVSTGLDGAISNEEAQQARTNEDYEETRQQIDALGIDENWFPDLSNARDGLMQSTLRKEELIAGLRAGADDYREGLPALKKKRFAKQLAWFLGLVFFAAAVVLWAIWGTLNYAGDTAEAEQITTWAVTNIPDWQSTYRSWLMPLAFLMSALVFFEIVVLFRLRKDIRFLGEKIDGLATQLDQIRLEDRVEVEPFSESVRNLMAESVEEAEEQESVEPVPDDYLEQVKALETLVRNRRAKRAEVNDGEAMIASRLTDEIQANNASVEQLDSALEVERKRLEEAARLGAISDDLNIRIADHMHRVKVQQVATSLLGSAAHHLSHRFNQSILKLAGDALPKFTQNRYEHLKIDENLDVRVFSNEKHDFMGFEEISSGTQRQIMLALRLAMSQELINAIEAGKQFIFFDEPFAFFDQDRIRETLAALPQFSDEISQIWLVAQEFPENVDVDLKVACSREQNQLAL